MNLSPDVSIIITNYNYSKYVARSIRSCLKQRHVNHEVIVVDDCSEDNSIEVIRPFEEDIRLFKTSENSGIAVASNLGIQKAKGQFFIRVDADDYVNSDMCYIMKTYLEANHDVFCVSCDYLMVDDFENTLERRYAEKQNISEYNMKIMQKVG